MSAFQTFVCRVHFSDGNKCVVSKAAPSLYNMCFYNKDEIHMDGSDEQHQSLDSVFLALSVIAKENE